MNQKQEYLQKMGYKPQATKEKETTIEPKAALTNEFEKIAHKTLKHKVKGEYIHLNIDRCKDYTVIKNKGTDNEHERTYDITRLKINRTKYYNGQKQVQQLLSIPIETAILLKPMIDELFEEYQKALEKSA